MKQMLTTMMEWVRPIAIALAYFFAEYFGTDAISKFHILGPAVVIAMSGTVALESLFLGEIASAKVGYRPDRAYQVQSGLNNLATALTAIIVLVMNWGRYADATVVCAMLLFFTLSAGNHVATALKEHNFKPVNLMRPLMVLILMGFLLPPMVQALRQ